MSVNTSRNINTGKSPVLKAVICGLISSVIYFIIIAVLSFFALKSGFSSSEYMLFGFISGAVSGFINGFITAKLTKEKGALFGLLSGFIQAIVCSAVLFLANGGTAGKGMLILSILIIGLSAVGGVTGVNMKIKKKY